jgi:hypothetical protein
VLVPLFTANHWFNERQFCRKWTEFVESSRTPRRMLWELDSPLKANWAS